MTIQERLKNLQSTLTEAQLRRAECMNELQSNEAHIHQLSGAIA